MTRVALGGGRRESDFTDTDLEATIKENCQRGRTENQQQEYQQKGRVYTH